MKVLDILVTELDIVDDRPVGVERSHNTIITELNRAFNVDGRAHARDQRRQARSEC